MNNSSAPIDLRQFDSPHLKMWMDHDILCCKFSNGLRLSLEVAKSCVEGRIFFSKGKSYPLLINMTGISSSTKDARQYMATIGVILSKADALVIKSSFLRVLGNLLLAIDKPRVPTKMFNNEEDARGWLSKFV